MPKVSINYSNTCIYKLVHFDDLNDENIYVGHCTNIVQRRYNHRTACCKPDNRDYNLKVYQFIRENGGWDQWEMILIEKYPCDNGDQARARERYWKRELNATLNKNEPGRTIKEWRENNKERLVEKAKIYYEDNKEEIAEKVKEYYENNKNKILEERKQYRKDNKEKIAEKNKEYREDNKEILAEKEKQYRENNKEEIAKKRKEYRQNNKEKIAEKGKEKATCECGSIVRKNGMPDHRKSNKHQEWLKNNNLIN